ncbi:MAG: heavy metal-binding domain-containing protein [Candidatus Omnitrophica bacterium]|nr:heavy metal-binding domain-containing protein [Candidatus Omnitrophota bacterium]
MNSIRNRAVFLFLIFTLTGCGARFEVVQLEKAARGPRPLSSDIQVMAGEPEQTFTEIALLEVKKRGWIPFLPPPSYALHSLLKRKAAELGADAVIRVEYEQDNLKSTTTAVGTAVHFGAGEEPASSDLMTPQPTEAGETDG